MKEIAFERKDLQLYDAPPSFRKEVFFMTLVCNINKNVVFHITKSDQNIKS